MNFLSLSSHNLKIETGRWSRIPRENRLCECGEVQDELHITLLCPKTNAMREKYDIGNFQTLNELMSNDSGVILDFIQECTDIFS